MKQCLLKKQLIYTWLELPETQAFVGCKVKIRGEIWVVIKVYDEIKS